MHSYCLVAATRDHLLDVIAAQLDLVQTVIPVDVLEIDEDGKPTKTMELTDEAFRCLKPSTVDAKTMDLIRFADDPNARGRLYLTTPLTDTQWAAFAEAHIWFEDGADWPALDGVEATVELPPPPPAPEPIPEPEPAPTATIMVEPPADTSGDTAPATVTIDPPASDTVAGTTAQAPAAPDTVTGSADTVAAAAAAATPN